MKKKHEKLIKIIKIHEKNEKNEKEYLKTTFSDYHLFLLYVT